MHTSNNSNQHIQIGNVSYHVNREFIGEKSKSALLIELLLVHSMENATFDQQHSSIV